MSLNEHEGGCNAWEWTSGQRMLNNARVCTCGFREQVAREQAEMGVRNRALKPLGMTDYEFLRTLGVDPEEDCAS